MKNIAFCFDLDSTLTQQEILPLLARKVGLAEEINALTIATLQGVIPFEGSFRLRCKLLEDIPISTIQESIKNIALFDQIIQFIKHNPDNCFVITGNLDVWIKDLLAKIPCQHYSSKADFTNDRLLGVKKTLNKADPIQLIKNKFDTIVAIGDGMGDVNMFRAANIRIAYAAVHKPPLALLNLANYVSFSEKSLCNLLNTLL